MRIMIASLVRDNVATRRKMDCVLGGDTFDALLSKFTNIFRYVTKDEIALAEFEQLRGHLDDINRERNTYIHSVWAVEEHGIDRWKTKRHIGKSRSMNDFEDNFDIEKLEKLAKKTEIMNDWVSMFHDVFISKMFGKDWYEKRKPKIPEKNKN